MYRCDWGDQWYFFKYHFTDLLFIPAILGIAYIIVKVIKRNERVNVPSLVIAIQVLLAIGLFEWYLPNYADNKEMYTQDWIDALMYVFGGIIFWGWQKAIQRL